MLEKPPYSKISYPSTPTNMGKNGFVEFKWESGSDVQTLWRKHGWSPPSENMTPPPPPPMEKYKEPFKRVK
jgi:hypothetical protein